MTAPAIILGEGRTATPVSLPDGSPAGYLVVHPAADGRPCLDERGHFIPTNPESPVRWNVENDDPLTLTLTPSLACRACGDHGFITGGKWVAA